ARLAPAHRRDVMVMTAKEVENFMIAPVFQPMPRPRTAIINVAGSIPLLPGRLRLGGQFVNAAFCLWGHGIDHTFPLITPMLA
ncbi:MAG: hypothetical protein ABJB10_12860, partial [Mesorhizobium sp.]